MKMKVDHPPSFVNTDNVNGRFRQIFVYFYLYLWLQFSHLQ